MIEIKNLKFQPLTFHLTGGKTLHIGPRERKTIAKTELSGELTVAEKRGMISLTETAEPAPVVPETLETTEPVGKTKKNNKEK